MRTPDRLLALAEFGIIEEVLRPLMSGKEAQVYLVVAGGKECIAKVYKAAQDRAFKNRAEYTEGRGTRNSRDQRAMGKGTGYGREKTEEAWHSTEVDMLRLLHRSGVRVPTPLRYSEGVLVMELVMDASGEPAPRLGDVVLSREQATAVYQKLLRETIRMLCAGVVHGDLSDFNVLLAADGPVIIDLPQAVDASSNPHARKMLVRDVNNLHRFLLRLAPGSKICRYAEEMWQLYEDGSLTPDTELVGDYVVSDAQADPFAVLDLIEDAEQDERFRIEGLGLQASRFPPARRKRGKGPPGSRGQRPPQPQPPQPARGTGPAKPNRPPQQASRPPQESNRPPQQPNRPQQSNRPPQQHDRPAQLDRPPRSDRPPQPARPAQAPGGRPPARGAGATGPNSPADPQAPSSSRRRRSSRRRGPRPSGGS